MESLKTVIELWPLFLGGVALVVWLVRLEGKLGFNERYIGSVDKKVEILQTKHDTLDSKTVEQLSQVRESLARIEGALGVRTTT